MVVRKAAATKATPRKATATKQTPTKSNARKTTQTPNRQSNNAASQSQPASGSRTNTVRNNNKKIGRVGNIGSDPELRFSANGTAVCSVSLAYSPYNPETRETGETVWYRCIGFNQMAENMATCLQTGMRVVVVGTPQLNEWETEDGEQRSTKEIIVDGIGPDIRFDTVNVNRAARTSGRNGTQAGMYDDEEPF